MFDQLMQDVENWLTPLNVVKQTKIPSREAELIFSVKGPISYKEVIGPEYVDELTPGAQVQGLVQQNLTSFIYYMLLNKLVIHIESTFMEFVDNQFPKEEIEEFTPDKVRRILPSGKLEGHNLFLSPSLAHGKMPTPSGVRDLRPSDCTKKWDKLLNLPSSVDWWEKGLVGHIVEPDSTTVNRVAVVTDTSRYDTCRFIKNNTFIVLPKSLELFYEMLVDHFAVNYYKDNTAKVDAEFNVDMRLFGNLAGCKLVKVD